MNDDDLRARVKAAHRDDAPPSFASLTARRPRRRAPLVLLPIAAALLLILWMRPSPPPAVAEVKVEFHDPLAFLLTPPGEDVLTGVPQFEGGELP